MMNDHNLILLDLLHAAARKDYQGYSKFDALNSPLLKELSFNSKWLRLLYTQLVKAMPLHVRPLLKVAESRNPKGIALFARAYFSLYRQTGREDLLRRGEQLVQWLCDHPSPGHENLCWGYNFVWQNTIFLQNEFEPNAVVTVFVGEALLHAHRLTASPAYLRAARSVAAFLLDDLPVLQESAHEMALAYVLRRVDAVVLNNQVLISAFLVKLWKQTGEKELLDASVRLMNYTVNRVTPYHAWFYTEPPKKSPISHDNYHTGGILDGLLEFFEATGDDRFQTIYWKGLDFYHRNLFEPDGAPRWMYNRRFPYDVHGAAQGILSFKKAARHEPAYAGRAACVADWAIEHLYRPRTHDFRYRQGGFFRWNYSLMRWCNAWMARALAEPTIDPQPRKRTCS